MVVLGIESSCDECSVAVVESGRRIRANIIYSQVERHAMYNGVVPEIASRMHTETILPVFRQALRQARITPGEIEGVAATSRPGLTGSLVVGLTFAKGFALSLGLPFIAVDHILSHIYAAQLTEAIAYPHLILLVSGGHTIIGKAEDYDQFSVLGTTIDDACGEAFDKVATHLGVGYPGGVRIDRLARKGDPGAYRFPVPKLTKGNHPYDVSYSGLKTAVLHQLEQFHVEGKGSSLEDIAASFERAAVDMLFGRLMRAVEETGITTVVAAGGVAANSYLREHLASRGDLRVHLPPLELCTDNAAMVAGLGYQYLSRGITSPLGEGVQARVPRFRHSYP
ncbi:MAG: tRNA (adenosine(37)-N6)-threonylcarbamoyltransferase complex transferase subunit TsaD [Alkalispirochaetaceae bacterium]